MNTAKKYLPAFTFLVCACIGGKMLSHDPPHHPGASGTPADKDYKWDLTYDKEATPPSPLAWHVYMAITASDAKLSSVQSASGLIMPSPEAKDPLTIEVHATYAASPGHFEGPPKLNQWRDPSGLEPLAINYRIEPHSPLMATRVPGGVKFTLPKECAGYGIWLQPNEVATKNGGKEVVLGVGSVSPRVYAEMKTDSLKDNWMKVGGVFFILLGFGRAMVMLDKRDIAKKLAESRKTRDGEPSAAPSGSGQAM